VGVFAVLFVYDLFAGIRYYGCLKVKSASPRTRVVVNMRRTLLALVFASLLAFVLILITFVSVPWQMGETSCHGIVLAYR
jgi:hypothetical protein